MRCLTPSMGLYTHQHLLGLGFIHPSAVAQEIVTRTCGPSNHLEKFTMRSELSDLGSSSMDVFDGISEPIVEVDLSDTAFTELLLLWESPMSHMKSDNCTMDNHLQFAGRKLEFEPISEAFPKRCIVARAHNNS